MSSNHDLFNNEFNLHSRGYLPHIHFNSLIQFITLRLNDSLPYPVIKFIISQTKILKDKEKQKVIERLVEKYLGKGMGCCLLAQHEAAKIVEDSLLYFDQKRYLLYSWVVMPNHIHFLCTPIYPYNPSKIIQTLKSYTTHKINQKLNQEGSLWFNDYFDRYIRNGKHLNSTIAYIHDNPVKAALCNEKEDWRFSSAWWLKNTDYFKGRFESVFHSEESYVKNWR